MKITAKNLRKCRQSYRKKSRILQKATNVEKRSFGNTLAESIPEMYGPTNFFRKIYNEREQMSKMRRKMKYFLKDIIKPKSDNTKYIII